jgi:hypothetical protein
VGHGLYDATDDPFTLASWWRQYPDANIGWALGPDYWVLDIDPRAGGDATWFALQQRYGDLGHVLLSHTGGGGSHLPFRSPPGGVLNKAPLGDGLDVQGEGSYIILPPSVHPETGKPYLWDVVDGLDTHLPQRAAAWLEHLVMPAAGAAPPAPPLTPDAPIANHTRNTTLARLAIAMARSGVSESAIRAAIAVENQRCEPPLDAAELDRVVTGKTTAYPAHPVMQLPTPLAPQGGASNGTAPAGTGQGWGTPFDFTQAQTHKQLLKTMLVAPRFQVDLLVPDGLTIMGAPAKSYKSLFALSLALATIGAGDWCNAFPVNDTGDVVFFALESSWPQLRRRMYQLCPHLATMPQKGMIHFFSGMHALPTFKHGLESVITQVIDHYKPRLIVIDPLSYLYRLGRQDDLSTATLDLLWPLADLVASKGVALFAPEHMRKRSKDDVHISDMLAGSWVKSAVVHGLLMMQRQGDELTMTTVMRDCKCQELSLSLTFDEDGFVQWGYAGATAHIQDLQHGTLKPRVLEELKTRRTPMTLRDLLDALGETVTDRLRDRVKHVLYRAEKDGTVVQTKRGEFLWIERI